MTGSPTHLLYLHGFRSSPQSTKARMFGDWLRAHRPEVHWWCPQLPASPRAALAMLQEGVAAWPQATSAVVGSSLGGYYAGVLAERLGWPAALLNPAVEPARDLASSVGVHTGWHETDARFVFRAEHLEELREMAPAVTKPERYFVLIAKGDELLDWHEMSARYAGAGQRVIEGSDHALSDFEAHLPHLLRFLRLA